MVAGPARDAAGTAPVKDAAHVLARRRWLGVALAAATSPVLAIDLTSTYAWYPQMAAYVTPATYDLIAHRYAEAAQRLAAANAMIDEDVDTRWPYRCYVQPRYAFALLKLGRAQEAAALLRQTVAAFDAIAAGGFDRFEEALAKIEDGLGLELSRVEYLRELMSAVRASQVIRRVDELPSDDGVRALDLWTLLAQVLGEANQRDELRRVYLARFASVKVAGMSPGNLIITEYRLQAFGQALAHAGFGAEAGNAWLLASQANANRIDLLMRQGAPHSVIAACIVRRVQLSNAILAADLDGRLVPQRRVFLADVLVTKSAATRYAGAMQQAIATQAPDAAAELGRLDDQIARLPASMPDPVRFLRLLAERDLVALRAAQAIRAETATFAGPDEALLSALQARLGAAAAIGFILLDGAKAQSGAAPPRQYLRYCVSREEVQLRLIGTQAAVDRQVHACRADFLGGATRSAAGARLAAALFGGLPNTITTAVEWLVEPDGALHLAPFDALPGADGKPLLDTHRLRFVTSLAQLPGEIEPVAGGAAVIVADPACAKSDLAAPPLAETGLRWSSDRVPLAAVPPLPEAREEARAAAAALTRLGMHSTVIVGADATASALQQVRRPAVLHIAAHAVLRSVIDSAVDGAEQAVNVIDLLLPGREAGLVLSGAGGPDVFLAKDVARLALHGTALAVLSACDSANGDVVVGETVASMRRATELAGAQSTVAAVWPVPSGATTELMRDFYAQLARGACIGDALRAAKLAAVARGAPPRSWAGFQLSGADGVLGRPV